MLRKRIIPCILIYKNAVVKTINFRKFNYIGDPINTCKIFNEYEVDEIIILDIGASRGLYEPNFDLIKEISNQVFIPLSYGGGLNSINQINKIFKIGIEKVVINSGIIHNYNLITEIKNIYGSQSIIASIDYYKDIFGNYKCFYKGTNKSMKIDPIKLANIYKDNGVGEILFTSVSKEGTWSGLDYQLLKKVSYNFKIPVIANGGAGSIKDIIKTFEETNCSAVSLGNMVVYKSKNMGVLVNYFDKKLKDLLTKLEYKDE